MGRLFLVTQDYSPRRGGVARYYKELARALGQVDVLTSVAGPVEAGVRRQGFSWWGWPRWLPLLWLVPWYKTRTGARILAAGQILPVGTALFIMRLAWGWPYIVFLHGLDIQLAQRNSWKRWLARQILQHAKLVVTNSNFTKSLALAAGATNETALVVYPGVALMPASLQKIGDLKRRYQLAGKLILLSAARLVPRKGIDKILQALPELKRQFPNLVYVVIGDGPERKILEAGISNQNLPAILLGEVSDEELSAWYGLCDVFALIPEPDAVDVEGFGMVYLEAQAAGKPVIGTRVGGVPEAIGQAGIVISDQAEFLTACAGLLSDKTEQQRLGALGRARVAREFTWGKQAAILRARLYAD